jgi:hypothetical protein
MTAEPPVDATGAEPGPGPVDQRGGGGGAARRVRRMWIAGGVALGLVAIVCVGVLVAARSRDPGPRLVEPYTPTGNRAWLKVNDAEVDHPYTVGFPIQVCLDSPGRVTVTAVRAVEPSPEIRVTAFAAHAILRFPPADIGSHHDSLVSAGWDPSGPQVLTGVCDKSAEEFEVPTSAVAVELRKSAATDAGAVSFAIDWENDQGVRGTIAVPYSVVLCDGTCPEGSPYDDRFP